MGGMRRSPAELKMQGLHLCKSWEIDAKDWRHNRLVGWRNKTKTKAKWISLLFTLMKRGWWSNDKILLSKHSLQCLQLPVIQHYFHLFWNLPKITWYYILSLFGYLCMMPAYPCYEHKRKIKSEINCQPVLFENKNKKFLNKIIIYIYISRPT